MEAIGNEPVVTFHFYGDIREVKRLHSEVEMSIKALAAWNSATKNQI